MSDVEFEDQVDIESQFQDRGINQGPRGLAGLMIKLGLAKTEKGANILLITLAAIFIILAFLVPRLLAMQNQAVGEQVSSSVKNI